MLSSSLFLSSNLFQFSILGLFSSLMLSTSLSLSSGLMHRVARNPAAGARGPAGGKKDGNTPRAG